MKKYQYKCSLLTDVILTSMAASEGYKESLDYIPGSKFLGITAGRLYDMETAKQRTLDLFHNGTVRFGDASLFHKEERMYKVPLSWFHAKGNGLSDDLYLHHKLNEEVNNDLKKNDIQLKQSRAGYFSPNNKEFVKIDQEFSLKSAHDRERRKSKDGQMFGYYSLKKGSTWIFEITDNKGIYADEIKKVIEGKHRIGRSRSAEFGLVEISFLKETKPEKEEVFKKEVIIYAQSNLCFYNESGLTTAMPSVVDLVGTSDAEILWDKSQVRTRNYKTWNRHRYNKDADRTIIERGSVFVVKLNTEISSVYFNHGIGSHKNEGFGEVIVNPSFLQSDNEKLPFSFEKSEIIHELNYTIDKGINDDLILTCLKARNKHGSFDGAIDKKVNDFKGTHESSFKGISKSQWGVLRNYGKNLNNYGDFKKMVFDESSGVLYKGQSENDWRTKNRRGILKEYLDKMPVQESLPFIVKLCNLMAKK